MKENPVKFSLADNFRFLLLQNFCSEAMEVSGFVVLLEDSHTGGLSSITVRIVYLFAILIL